MIPTELAKLCVKSATVYLNYLKLNNRGCSEIDVRELACLDDSGLLWKLRLKSRIYELDTILIRHKISGAEYGQGEFVVKEYDCDTGVLIIKFGKPPEHFSVARPQDILVVSSLLFLVENVREWFGMKGAGIHWPTLRDQQYDEEALAGLDTPLPDQAQALKVVSASPVSYVWGPAGTGKTRLVLAHAVLRMLNDRGVRVGIFAPTNLALEQAMGALIEGAKELGIKSEKFLRLGAPSSQFAQKYPEVCEVQGIERKMQEAEREIKNLNVVLHFRRGANILHSGESLQMILDQMRQLMKKRDSILRDKAQLCKQIEGLDSELARIPTRIRRFFSSRPLLEEVLREEKHAELTSADQRLREIDDRIDVATEDFRSICCESDELGKLQQDFNPRKWPDTAESLRAIVDKVHEWLASKRSIAEPYENNSIEEVERKKREWEDKLKQLRAARIEERIKECNVLGMTLDLFIGRFRDSAPHCDHVLLDEAGYAPLVKALPLFHLGAPVTLLGDHKQLPPVVEMNDETLRMPDYGAVRLWASSAILAEVALDSDLDEKELLDSIWQADRKNLLPLRRTSVAVLRTSRRFGNNLCRLLDELIYKFGFRSKDVDDLGIWFVDAPQRTTPTGRENAEEAATIASLIKSGLGDDFAVITPYKDQVKLLGQQFPQLRRDDRILTIHRAQGREWDTVVVSIADGSRQPKGAWFTDTTKGVSRGVQVMNTALSRARKKLILVCDVNFWKNKSDAEQQLVSRLLAQARSWDMDT